MHPEIKKFWEEIGEVDLTLSAPIVYYVVQRKSDLQYITIAEITDDSATYYYNDSSYTEDEMLRIIRMDAFL